MRGPFNQYLFHEMNEFNSSDIHKQIEARASRQTAGEGQGHEAFLPDKGGSHPMYVLTVSSQISYQSISRTASPLQQALEHHCLGSSKKVTVHGNKSFLALMMALQVCGNTTRSAVAWGGGG